MEKIRDLLTPLEEGGGKSGASGNLRIREDKDKGVYVEGATEYYTATAVGYGVMACYACTDAGAWHIFTSRCCS